MGFLRNVRRGLSKGKITKLSSPEEKVVKSVRDFSRAPAPNFTAEQKALQSMFGHGEKFWGVNNEPVRINNDLNPRMRGDMGTASLFGFGPKQSQTSDLFGFGEEENETGALFGI